MLKTLIDFAVVVLELLIFKLYGIIRISKVEFLNFSGNERAKRNQKILKVIENFLGL